MSTELTAQQITIATDAPNVLEVTNTHGIGDSCNDKPISPSNSRDNISDISGASSFTSCDSFKTICKAWKNRGKNTSTVSIVRSMDGLDAKVEDLSSKLHRGDNAKSGDIDELAKCLSMSVVYERQHSNDPNSSDDDIPRATNKYIHRFIQPEEINEAHATFKLFDVNGDDLIELTELKLALEKLSVPQTHLAAKEFMAEAAGEQATKMNFKQFLLTYAAILQNDSPKDIKPIGSAVDLTSLTESVDVAEVGVSGAKQFFEAKIAEQIPTLSKQKIPNDNIPRT